MKFDLNDPATMALLLNEIGILLSHGQREGDNYVIPFKEYDLAMSGLAKLVFQLENNIMVTVYNESEKG